MDVGIASAGYNNVLLRRVRQASADRYSFTCANRSHQSAAAKSAVAVAVLASHARRASSAGRASRPSKTLVALNTCWAGRTGNALDTLATNRADCTGGASRASIALDTLDTCWAKNTLRTCCASSACWANQIACVNPSGAAP